MTLSRRRPALEPYEQLRRRPWFAAPPWNAAAGSTGDVLTLHTIQTRAAYETLHRTGSLSGDLVLGDPTFAEAYEWMGRRMTAQLPTVGDGIIWLWARTTYRALCRCTRLSRGEVMITVRIPRERVLLSDFDLWHLVLNRGLAVPVLAHESDEAWWERSEPILDEWDQRTDAYRDRPIDDWPPDLRAELESSWDSIFNLDHHDPPAVVQATLRTIHADDVVRAVRIS